jgi:hypothetical protein
MNLPSGNALKTGLDVAVIDFFALLRELSDRKFSGYAAIATQGKYGIEEGTQVFDDGKPVASFYEYYAFRKMAVGGDAFKRVLNASTAIKGVIDVVELTNEQVQLAIAFNEAAIYIPSAAELRPRKIEFDPLFEEEFKFQSLSPTRDELLKKYKVSGAVAQPSAGDDGLPAVDDLLERLAGDDGE